MFTPSMYVIALKVHLHVRLRLKIATAAANPIKIRIPAILQLKDSGIQILKKLFGSPDSQRMRIPNY